MQKRLCTLARYLDTGRQMGVSPRDGPSNSSGASGIFFQGDINSPALSGHVRSGLGPLNNTTNSSAPSIGASSLVTDANSSFSSGPQLQRSASINNETYMRVPASPMSFSSHNISGPSMLDQNPTQDQLHSIKTEPGINSIHTQKKPRLNMRQEDVLQQQVFQQMLQRQEGHQNSQLNAIMQQQRIAQQRQQQQILQSMPHMQRASMTSQHIRPNIQVQANQSPVRNISDSGLCSRRLMQYMFHQSHRPPDNSIMYWRKFVNEYFAPKSKKRWCLSQYESFGSQALGAFPQAAMDAWHCDICGSKSGKGFEATYEVLPRLSQIKFDRGIVDELLFLDMPRESRLASGMMVLEYAKAVQESVYEQLRVVREGQLRITFTPELKILSWEFCARRHEEFFSRRAITPQVNQLLQVAHKYQTAVSENGTAGVPHQDMQASCNMFLTAGRQLVKNLELHSLNDMGFSKRYVRCLQISEVVNGMKDLIDFSRENRTGPIESLKSYPRLPSQKLPDPEQSTSTQNMQTDQATLNKIMAMQNNNHLASRIANNIPNYTAAPNNYQYMLRTASTPNNIPSQQQQPFLTKAPSFNGSSTTTNINFPNQSNAQTQTSQGNQRLEQHAIQQILHDMANDSNKRVPQQSASAVNNATADVQSSDEVVGPAVDAKAGAAMTPSRSNNNNSSSSSSNFSEKPDVLPNLDLPGLDHDILQEFAESFQW